MSAPQHPGFRFASEAQWNACLFAGADRSSAARRSGLHPFVPYGLPPANFASEEGHAPTLTDEGAVLWRDDAGQLRRLAFGDEMAEASPAPAAVATARDMAAIGTSLWVVTRGGALEVFDRDSLVRLFGVGLAGWRALDLARDGRDGAYALLAADGARRIVHIDCAGNIDEGWDLAAESKARAVEYLARAGMLVVLASGGEKLLWIDPAEGRIARTTINAGLRPCFAIAALGSDGCDRLFLAGSDGAATGGGHRVVMVDAGGNLLGTLPLDAAPHGVAAGRGALLVTTRHGLARFEPSQGVPRGGDPVGASVLTPVLRTPVQGPQGWQRVEAKVLLPPGCTLEIAFAASAGQDRADQLETRLRHESVSPATRLADWRAAMTPRRYRFHGDPSGAPGKAVTLSAPLHDVVGTFLWVEVTLSAAPGGALPALSELAVHYPGQTLIEKLPAIYRRSAIGEGDFLRALMGTLEAGSQQLDAVIGTLGRRINPESASGEWLGFVADWLGLPWDDSLSLDQKRRLAASAAALARGRGTRAGLEALLAAIVPGDPPRYRIVDTTAEFGIAMVGGTRCAGSGLPALLAGLPANALELGGKAVLGRGRLPCGEAEGDTARLLGHIRIEIAASGEERRAWSPWLATLVEAMLPASARARIVWVQPASFTAGQLHEGLTLESGEALRLGSHALAGPARLGGRHRTTLPRRLAGGETLQ